MDKKKLVDPNIKECSNCGTSGANLTCGECKAAHYCSNACQKQHWNNGHKGMCIAPEKRRPQAPSTNPKPPPVATDDNANKKGECPICFEFLLGPDGTLCTLPCKHEFHQECVEELRKHGVLQACPLCRAALPAGPGKLFEAATRMYVTVGRKVVGGATSWQSLTSSQKKAMAEARATFVAAGYQGHAGAQYSLGIIYHNLTL
jgi:hypothetical protein